MNKLIITILLSILNIWQILLGQSFEAPVGDPLSSAIYKDSSVFISWGDDCKIYRGYIQIDDTTIQDQGSNRASFGKIEDALGKADNKAVSLGDGGNAIYHFSNPITNGKSFDFAVFENSFNDEFLEFAFVEVSTDGNRFVRFPSVSNVQTKIQTSGFENTDTKYIHNLAGKYRAFYGTPFDLKDLQDSNSIDLNNIHYIKIIDVVGCIEDKYASRDSKGNKINDPWPTPFFSGGFDLDAIGIIYQKTITQIVDNEFNNSNLTVFPNPFINKLNIKGLSEIDSYSIFDSSGKVVCSKATNLTSMEVIDLQELPNGIYILKVLEGNRNWTKKIIKN